MLSDTSRPIIEATAPVIAARIPSITPEFYRRMFEARPDLMDGLFSRSNQKSGAQPQALAGSIVHFATYELAHPDEYPEVLLSRIAHKHASLGLPEIEYPTVYEHLFAAIAADLGDAATPEVVDAWSEVYWLMADALVKIEKGLYAGAASDKPFAPWRLVHRDEVGQDVVAFTFEPADDTPITPATPGQYLSIETVVSDGLRQPRQFTLLPSEPTQRRIAVKLDPAGEVTPILHRDLAVGDVVELSNPYGDLVLTDETTPLILASAGIGITPILAMLDGVKRTNPERRVVVLHADASPDAMALRDELEGLVASMPDASLQYWFESGARDGDMTGYMDVSRVDIPADASALLCGPLPFMQATKSALVAAGIPAPRVRYEIFGPDIWQSED